MQLDPTKTAFLFPGQGSQKVGMGKELAQTFKISQETFSEGDEILGFEISSMCWGGPEEHLNDTINTQPALLLHSVAVLRVLSEKYPDFRPAYVAGHSMGEFSALVAAQSISFRDALILVRKRGELMKRSGELAPGGMGAILGLDIQTVEKICVASSAPNEIVQVANDNCPGQVVISGDKVAIERAMPMAKESGARKAVSLAVSIAAHSPLMASAQIEFSHSMKSTAISEPNIPIVGNVSAKPMISIAEIHADLEAQLTSRVRWTETIQYLVQQGISNFIEIGSGNVLSSLTKRIDPIATRISLGNPEDFDKFAATL